jgi:hypothetical protein
MPVQGSGVAAGLLYGLPLALLLWASLVVIGRLLF